jgi:hypothetical protein
MKQATQHDLDVAHRILSYIIGTKDMGLTFQGKGDITLWTTCDASYANHPDRKSHFGITMHIGDGSGSIHSVSKKSSGVPISSTEAEYNSMFEDGKLIAWARQYLYDLGFPQLQPTMIYEDNLSTIHMVQNGNDKGRTKHMDVRYHFIRTLLLSKKVQLSHLPTHEMTADILTKPLDSTAFIKLRSKLLGT